MWRAKYDMPPDEFTKELDRLWEQVRPLYLQLHAYVRMKLREKYGDVVPANGPIPAHLLGNIWAQDWSNIYPLVAPGRRRRRLLADRHPEAPQDERRSTWCAPASASTPRSDSSRCRKTFWERSLFVRPKDREVVCHASAWDIDYEEDVRIKMCIEPTAEDFTTIHHELGHNFYQRAYKDQPVLFRDSANDGFHEAIGDTIALSVTPEYLVKIGLLDKAPDASRDIGLLHVARAREGRVPAVRPADRSVALEGVLGRGHAGRLQQGVVGPAAEVSGRRAAVAARRGVLRSGREVSRARTTRRTRAISSRDILQFQFHRALAKTAGCTTPLHRCSIYESKEAGQRLNAMLSMGLSTPVAGRARGADRIARRWTRRRSSTTSRRSRRGSTSSSRARATGCSIAEVKKLRGHDRFFILLVNSICLTRS